MRLLIEPVEGPVRCHTFALFGAVIASCREDPMKLSTEVKRPVALTDRVARERVTDALKFEKSMESLGVREWSLAACICPDAVP